MKRTLKKVKKGFFRSEEQNNKIEEENEEEINPYFFEEAYDNKTWQQL